MRTIGQREKAKLNDNCYYLLMLVFLWGKEEIFPLLRREKIQKHGVYRAGSRIVTLAFARTFCVSSDAAIWILHVLPLTCPGPFPASRLVSVLNDR